MCGSVLASSVEGVNSQNCINRGTHIDSEGHMKGLRTLELSRCVDKGFETPGQTLVICLNIQIWEPVLRDKSLWYRYIQTCIKKGTHILRRDVCDYASGPFHYKGFLQLNTLTSVQGEVQCKFQPIKSIGKIIM